MKLKRLIIILVMATIGWTNTQAQTYSLLVHDESIEDFFIALSRNLPHQIVKLNKDILEWNERDIYGEQDTLFQIGELTKGIMEIDTVKAFFTEQDLKYVEKQYQNLEGVQWYEEDFRKFEILDSIGLRKIMSRTYSAKKLGKNYSYTFSVPLFSMDKQYAIVQQEFDCGFECSTYCIIIYKQSTDQKSWDKITSWKCISAGIAHE